MPRYRIETEKGVYEVETEGPAPPQASAPQAPQQEYGVLDAVVDFASGFKKGAKKLIVSAVPPVIRSVTGIDRAMEDPEVAAQFTPSNTAEKAGFATEQVGEFFLPAGVTGKAAKAVAGLSKGIRGEKAFNIGARAALEGGAAGTVAGMQSGGDPEAIRDAALLAGGVTAGGAALANAAKPAANALRESAVKQYGRVLGATKQGDKYLSQKIAPRLVEEGVTAGTLKGLQSKAASRVQELGKAISDEWTNLPSGTATEVEPLMNAIQREAEAAHMITAGGRTIPKGPEAKRAMSHITALQETLLDAAEMNAATGKVEIPVDRLRDLRQYFDGIAARAGRYEGKALADASAQEAHGLAADAIRKELGQQFPNIDKLNKDFAFWKKVEKVTADTVLRREGQAKPLTKRMFQAAGAAAGAPYGFDGAFVGAATAGKLQELMSSTAWGTVSAVAKDRLAKALASGSKPEAEFAAQKIFRSIGASMASAPAESPSR